MHVSQTLDCNGLSNAPTVLRIKQALVDQPDDKLPIGVLVGPDCDIDRISSSLGDLADDIHLMTVSDEIPAK
jgi:hypothetical protein